MKITINDVAKAAGVSKATVSRVLSNSERISDDTKRKVNDVIKNMGYIPNATARNLAKNSTFDTNNHRFNHINGHLCQTQFVKIKKSPQNREFLFPKG